MQENRVLGSGNDKKERYRTIRKREALGEREGLSQAVVNREGLESPGTGLAEIVEAKI